MGWEYIFLLVVMALQSVTVSAGPLLDPRSSVCSSGIYGELAPILVDYPIALSFCSTYFPLAVKCTTATLHKRASATTAKTTTKPTPKTSSPSSTEVSTTKTSTTSPKTSSAALTVANLKASAMSKCQQQPVNIISTLCSCIETPKACPAVSTTTTTTTTSTTTTSTTPSPTCDVTGDATGSPAYEPSQTVNSANDCYQLCLANDPNVESFAIYGAYCECFNVELYSAFTAIPFPVDDNGNYHGETIGYDVSCVA